MNIIESIIEALKHNSSNLSDMQQFRMTEVLKTIFVSRPSRKDNTNTHQEGSSTREEFTASTVSAQIAGLCIQSDMSKEEISLTEKCSKLVDKLLDPDVTPEEKNGINNELKNKYRILCDIRKKYDKTVEFNNSLTDRANKIIEKCKSPYYRSGQNNIEPKDYFERRRRNRR